MTKNRRLLVFGLIALVPGVLLLGVAGLWVFMSVTATPIHPDPAAVRSVSVSAPSPKWTELVAQAQRLVRASLTTGNLPALSVAVAVDGTVIWAEGFGWADLEGRVPATPETRFRIGTASKMLTSVAIGLLMEERRLRLDDDIHTYVPAYPRKPWPVTLRQLMAHEGGIRPDEGDEENWGEHCERTVDGIRRFADSPLLFEPGTGYRDSSYGWILASAAVEAAAQEPFGTFMRRRVFEPLTLNDTRTDSAVETVPGQAVAYFPRFAADPRYGPQAPAPLDQSCFSGASAFLSTPSDMVRFVTAVNAGEFLKPATVELLQTSQRLPSGRDTGYGLGWDLDTIDLAGAKVDTIGHDGSLMGGVAVSVLMIPSANVTVAVFSNTSYAGTPAIAQKLAQLFGAAGSRSQSR